jgi:hypothetical protein
MKPPVNTPKPTLASAKPSLMNAAEKKQFAEATQWVRPLTRWATRFSMNCPGWVPAGVRNAPLKLSALILKRYVKAHRQGGCS